MTDIVYSKKEALGFCCEAIPNGWTYTLITRLGEMLREIEGRYGTRDRDWTLLGIEFGGSRPCLWYPGDCGYVSIKLSDNARTDPQRAFFQLAHETVHLLSPTGKRNALVIEEGLATIYAREMCQRLGVNLVEDGAEYVEGAEYVYAKLITQEFLNLHPDGIRQLRTHKRSFCDFSAILIHDTFPDVSEKLAADLCEPFGAVEARLNPGA
jgi:hypothetical protein